MFEYRAVTDVDAVAELAKRAFTIRQPAHSAIAEWLDISLRQGRELFGVYDGPTLVSVYMLYDYRMRLRRSVMPMGGIGLLCSRLDARGKGAVRFMLERSLETMREAGHVVSVLNPFDQSFYRKYGWELYEQYQRVELRPDALVIPEGPSVEEVVDLPFPDDASMAFYNEYARDHYTLIQRGAREWERRTTVLAWDADAVARGVVRVSRDRHVVGLIDYRVSGPADDWHPRFTVNLFVAADESAKRAMLRYLKRLSHQVKTLRLELPVDVDLWPYLSDKPNERAIEDYFMIRIVSVGALDGLEIDAGDLSVAIEVVDEQAPWNAGGWRLTVEDGVLRVAPSGDVDLRSGIGALSSVVSGFTDFGEMIAAGRIEPLPSYAGQELPRATTFLADYF